MSSDFRRIRRWHRHRRGRINPQRLRLPSAMPECLLAVDAGSCRPPPTHGRERGKHDDLGTAKGPAPGQMSSDPAAVAVEQDDRIHDPFGQDVTRRNMRTQVIKTHRQVGEIRQSEPPAWPATRRSGSGPVAGCGRRDGSSDIAARDRWQDHRASSESASKWWTSMIDPAASP